MVWTRMCVSWSELPRAFHKKKVEYLSEAPVLKTYLWVVDRIFSIFFFEINFNKKKKYKSYQ